MSSGSQLYSRFPGISQVLPIAASCGGREPAYCRTVTGAEVPIVVPCTFFARTLT
jgi:hypothetical protein